ncbi:hypothetical protein V8G69_04560 [Gaetbulibacter sp. M235]|uniref:hypothetical protein n=1 Tax=Gaetbulibacter sp. M235 TaxID=3126510 RepID=UPI00374E902F
MTRTKKINFLNVGYYFIGLIVFSFLGFWPSYFSKFFDGTADFNIYFHFHFVMAMLWIMLLIIQPILIKKKKMSIHRQVGKLSFIVLPLLIVSVILLKHSLMNPETIEGLGLSLWFSVKHIAILGVMFTIAMAYRHNMQIHARAMIATGIEFIEPGFGRFIFNTLSKPDFNLALGISISIMYALIAYLIFIERKQTSGRWVFPLFLLMSIIFHYLIFFEISFEFWDSFAEWFAKLPIT